MTGEPKDQPSTNDHLACFGDYAPEDVICRKFCALRLRCAIEQNQSIQMEMIEDLITYENHFTKLQ